MRGGASPRLFRSANKIIKLYPACGAVSATKSTLFSPSGQSTFYFLPSLQRRLPLRVDLVKSWLRAGPRDGREKKNEAGGGREINLLTLFTLASCTHNSALGAHTSTEAEHARGCYVHIACYILQIHTMAPRHGNENTHTHTHVRSSATLREIT